MKIKSFTFNPFQENTYIIYDKTAGCIIIDPGCYEPEEKKELHSFLSEHNLKPQMLLNTHCHIDHVFGNRFIYESYGLKPMLHQIELPYLKAAHVYGTEWGVFMEESPEPAKFLTENDTISFGSYEFKILFTPGHSPGSICFYSKENNFVIAGDVLFQMSIGRTDLPGGDHETLIKSIREELFLLPDETIVYPGHGDKTTIGYEKKNNPFLN